MTGLPLQLNDVWKSNRPQASLYADSIGHIV